MDRQPEQNLFSARARFRLIRGWGGIFHLLSVGLLVVMALYFYPSQLGRLDGNINAAEMISQRQSLVEAMDKIMRYEHYHRELTGHFTRDITRLGLPEKLSNAALEDVRRNYEISVLEIGPNGLLILASGSKNMDRLTIDERHRVNANFILPPPTKAYLYEEAERMMNLQASGRGRLDGAYANYWKLDKGRESDGALFMVGTRQPVLGERRERGEIFENRQLATIFNSVSDQLRNRLADDTSIAAPKSEMKSDDAYAFLEQAKQAQHIFQRERGRYARRWEDLEAVTGYAFITRANRAQNIRLHNIEINDNGYRVTLEGTKGEIMGEQFVLDQSGNIRQVRYTDALKRQIQESTDILQNAFKFQISEIRREENRDVSKPFLDSEKSAPVKSDRRGK